MSNGHTAYDDKIEVLLDRLIQASARAGVSGSGLVISASTGHDALFVQYLRGAVLARLEGVTPPFKPQDRVRAQSTVYGCGQKTIKQDEVLTVERVFYGRGHWTLEFKEFSPFDRDGRCLDRHLASAFSIVPAQADPQLAPPAS